jgi:hypothetical protein
MKTTATGEQQKYIYEICRTSPNNTLKVKHSVSYKKPTQEG